MSQFDSKQDETSKMKKLLNGPKGEMPLELPPEEPVELPMEKLQRTMGGRPLQRKKESKPESNLVPAQQSEMVSVPASQPEARPVVQSRSRAGRPVKEYKFLQAFWTIASIMSFTVNIVLLIALAIILQNLGTVGVTLLTLPDHLLGGLYNNFVKMDQAHIRAVIPVSKEIPVQFNLNVSGATNVTLSENVPINGAFVTVNTGGLNIDHARANIVLPKGTVLPIFIENLVVPVDQKVLAELNVGVDIPLSQTELHEPFTGLRQVVEPFYCLLKNCP